MTRKVTLLAALLCLFSAGLLKAQDCTTPMSVPQFYNFDNITAGSNPPCWTAIMSGSSGAGTFPSVYTWSPNARSGSNYFEMESSTGQEEIVKLALFDASNPIMLSFYGHALTNVVPLYFIVGYYESGGSTFIPYDTITLPVRGAGNYYGDAPVEVYFNNVPESEFHPAFRCVGSGSSQYTVFIDDMTVQEIPTCPSPIAFSAFNIQATQLDLQWTSVGTESSWNIAYDTMQITDFSGATVVSESSTPATLTGLDANTHYYIYLQADCGGGDESPWVGPLQVTTQACDEGCYYYVQMHDTYGDGWNGNNIYYTIGGVEQSHHATITGGTSGNDSLYVCDGQSISFFFGTGSYATETSFEIENAQNEIVYTCSNGSSLTNGAAFYTEMASCTPSTCPRPTNFAVTGTTNDSVMLVWSEAGTATSWVVAYATHTMDSNDASSMTVEYINDTTAAIIDGLADSLYYFYVQADCGSDQSYWVGPVTAVPNVFVLPANYNGSITTCGGHIADDGDLTGNYSSNQQSYLTIYPLGAGMGVSLNGTQWLEGSSWDYIIIYDGVGTSGEVLFTSQGAPNSSSNGMAVSATSISGPLTLYFRTDGSGNYAGFDLEVSCFSNTCPLITNLTASSIGSTDVDITWNADSTESAWNVVYDTIPVSDFTNYTPMQVTTNAASLTGLTPATTYYIYVQADCGSEQSDYVGPLTVTPGSWNMRANQSDTLHTCSAVIYDDGGINGDYSSSQQSYLIIYPSTEGMGVAVNGTQWLEGSSWDYLKIYDGVGTSGALLFDSQGASSSASSGMAVSATSISGPLTIFFRTDGSGNYAGFVLNVQCFSNACPMVTNLAVTGTNASSIDISWTADSSETAWNVVYDTVPVTDFTNYTPTAVTTTSATLTGLTGGSTYYIYVQADCGIEQSDYVGPLTAVPGSMNMRANQTDTVYMCGGVIYDDGGLNGTYSSSQDSYIILMPDAPLMAVSISGSINSESCCDYLEVYDGVGANGTAAATYRDVQTISYTSLSGPLTLRFHSDVSVVRDGFVINVSCVSNSCPVISDLHATGLGSTSITLGWTANGAEQSWQIVYDSLPVSDFTGYTPVTTTTNSATINGLLANHPYYFYIKAICSATDESSWSPAVLLNTTICDNAQIATTTVGGSAGTSSYSIGNSCYNYSYTQTILDSAEMVTVGGAEITAFQFEVSSEEGQGMYFDSCMVYLGHTALSEFDGSFEVVDSSFTLVYTGPLNFTGAGWKTFEFDNTFTWDGHSNVILAVARYQGNYSCSAYFTTTSCTGDKTIYWYNDYTTPDVTTPPDDYSVYTDNTRANINLIACGSCGRPSVSVSSHDYQSATIVWSGSAAQYEVAVKANNEPTWPNATSVANLNTYTFSALQPAVQYTARVRAICDEQAGEVSDWSMTTFVTDSLPCFAPSNVEVDAQGQQAVISWTAGGNETQWIIRVYNTTFDQEYTATTNPYTVTGLTANVTYNVTVSSLCGNGAVQSEWTEPVSFTTVPCDPVTNVQVSDITTTTANVSWTAGANNTGSWKVDWNYHGASVGSAGSTTVNTTSAQLTGLTAGAEYDVSVSAICAAGYESNYTTQTFTTTVGIASVEDGMSLSIYPNPATGNTTITLSGVNGSVTLSVIDMSGRTVKSTTMECSGDCQQVIDVDHLAAGAYFVRVYGDNVNTVKKLIVK